MRKFFLVSISLLAIVVSVSGQSVSADLIETDDYSILFPGKTQHSTQTVPSTLGDLLVSIVSYEALASMLDSNYLYMIIESRYPDSTIHSDSTRTLDIVFRGAIDGALNNGAGKLITETPGNIGKYPARTIEVDFQNGRAVLKMVMVLRESKMIILQTFTETAKYPNASLDDFFQSFKIK
jgi:hypothetical protein